MSSEAPSRRQSTVSFSEQQQRSSTDVVNRHHVIDLQKSKLTSKLEGIASQGSQVHLPLSRETSREVRIDTRDNSSREASREPPANLETLHHVLPGATTTSSPNGFGPATSITKPSVANAKPQAASGHGEIQFRQPTVISLLEREGQKPPSRVASPSTDTAPQSPAIASATEGGVKESTHLPELSSEDGKIHILLGATGSVATIKIPLIINKLREVYRNKCEIQLVLTSAAEHFTGGVKIPPDVKVWHDKDEWTSRHGRADSVLHVRLRRWADILLVAPMSANTLAKMANGICDNLITSVIRAWNPVKPLLIAPAMNTHMYTNPMTKKHIQLIKEEYKWVEILRPIEKVLVCGDIGMGGMCEWTDIVQKLVMKLGGPEDDTDEDDENEEEEDDDFDEDKGVEITYQKGADGENLSTSV